MKKACRRLGQMVLVLFLISPIIAKAEKPQNWNTPKEVKRQVVIDKAKPAPLPKKVEKAIVSPKEKLKEVKNLMNDCFQKRISCVMELSGNNQGGENIREAEFDSSVVSDCAERKLPGCYNFGGTCTGGEPPILNYIGWYHNHVRIAIQCTPDGRYKVGCIDSTFPLVANPRAYDWVPGVMSFCYQGNIYDMIGPDYGWESFCTRDDSVCVPLKDGHKACETHERIGDVCIVTVKIL